MRRNPESCLSVLIDGASDPIWSVNLEGQLTFLNRAARDIFWKTFQRKPVPGESFTHLLPSGTAAAWRAALERTLHAGPFEAEYKSPADKAFELAFAPIRNGNAVTGVSVIARDITERKRAAEALSGFRNMFEHSGAVLLLVDPENGIILDANRATEAYYGYPRERLVGASIALVNTLPVDKVREEWARAEREGRNFFSFQHRLASGEVRDVRVYSSLVVIGGKKRLYSIVFDITEQLRIQEQLRENAEVLAEAQTIGGIGNYVLDLATGLWTSSEALDEIFGISPEYVRSVEGWLDLIHPGDRAMMSHHFRHEVLELRQPFDKEYRILRAADGTERWVHGLGRLTYGEDGLPRQMRGVIRNITESKQAEIALRASEQRYRTIFSSSLACISVHRVRDGVLLEVNQAFLTLLGLTQDEVIGKTGHQLRLWADPEAYEKMRKALECSGSLRDERTQFRKKDGDLIWVLISCSTIEIEKEPCVLSIFRDVSDAKAAEDKIWNLAFYDPLTRLPNRRLLMDRLRQMLSGASRSVHMRALLFIDLDDFKTLNDTLGHQNGDELLRQVAQRLVGCVRESDTVARLGGDEFVILLDGLDAQPEKAAAQTEAIANKILNALEKPCWLSDRECFSTASIGITVFGGKQGNAEELLHQADIAMYQAKMAGRNTLRFFEPALQTAVQQRAEMNGEMRTALRHGHFLLHLQPQMHLDTLVGVETLVRWQHTQRGQLLPCEFLPLAEENGLILPLGKWVLNSVCAQIAAWSREFPSRRVEVSVNISARQFHQKDFTRQVLAALERAGVDPSLLNVEVTESLLLDNLDEAAAKMRVLKQRGIRFSLDGFGAGCSSLSSLKRLPFDQVKIDRSFIHDLRVDAGSRAIVRTVIALGHALGFKVMAEGVETEEQHRLLMDLGCHLFQGFLFGRPLPLRDFTQTWLEDAESSSSRM